jgi:glycosyltransferase-like protein
MSLNIALLMHSLNPRGGVVHTLELADALCARGHQVTVFAAAKPGEALFRGTHARLSIAPLAPAAPLPGTDPLVHSVGSRIAALVAHLREQPELHAFDVMHAQCGITANALAVLHEEGRIPGFVRTVHHIDSFDAPQVARWQARGIRAAARVLCVSTVWQQTLARDWAITADTVPNGVNLARFHHPDATTLVHDTPWLQRFGLQAPGPVWLSVGGVEARKNTIGLLQGFAQARRQQPDARLVIAGGASLLDHDAYGRRFHDLRQALGLQDAVQILGALPDEALPALYRRASALAMPSLQEGFGLVALEALACGTPAIVSRRAPFTEHFQPEDVLWCEPEDPASIAQALLSSLGHTAEDHARVHTLLARAPAVCSGLSWSRSAARHEAIYLHELSRRACGSGSNALPLEASASSSSASASSSSSTFFPPRHHA